GGWYGLQYFRNLPPVVEADGRIDAPEGRVISVVNGRLTELYVAEGQDVGQGEVVAWVEDPVDGVALPIRAPLAGTVTNVPGRHDENVIQVDVIALIHQLSRMDAVLEVEETAIANVQVGQRVELRLGSTGTTVSGRVREIAHEPLPPVPGVSERVR